MVQSSLEAEGPPNPQNWAFSDSRKANIVANNNDIKAVHQDLRPDTHSSEENLHINHDSMISFDYRPQANYNIVEMPESSVNE